MADLGSPTGGWDEGIFITALGIAQICSWGSLYYSFPLLAEAMGSDLGWAREQVYGAVTLGLLLSAVAAYPVGSLIDRGWGRWVMAGGSVLAGILLLGWSQVLSLRAFYVLLAGIGSLQAATLYDPVFAVIVRRVGALRARGGITALTLFGGFASTVFVPLVQVLLDHTGWRGTLVALGLINIGLCGILYGTAIQPHRDVQLGQKRGSACAKSVRWAIRNPVFWALAIALMAYAATFAAFTFHLYPLLLERGLSTQQVVWVMACIGPAQVAGRIAIWVMAPKASVKGIGAVMVGLFPLLFLGISLLPPAVWVLATLAILFGGTNGVMTIVRGMVVPEMLSHEAYGSLNGLLTAPGTLARAVAPAGAAALWSLTETYDAVVVALMAGSFALAGGFWLAVKLQGSPEPGEQGSPLTPGPD
ncbi:MAG: MFS transporter [Thermostichus sp. DG02_5_bins_236]